MGGEHNEVHEQEIWRQRLQTETDGAKAWFENWGFLTGREPPEVRGFSTNVAKYAYGGGQWSVKSVRVADNSDEGIAAALSEQKARSMMSTLSWDSKVPNPTKACEAQGAYKVRSGTPK